MAGKTLVIERTQLVARPLDEVFAFFADATNLELLTPPFLRFRVLTPTPIAMGPGIVIDYRLSLHGVPVRWRTLIERWEPGRCFVDLQLTGPYAYWEHTHTFEESDGGTTIGDQVRYRMPFGAAGAIAHRLLVARDLERVFAHRHAQVERLLGGEATVPRA